MAIGGKAVLVLVVILSCVFLQAEVVEAKKPPPPPSPSPPPPSPPPPPIQYTTYLEVLDTLDLFTTFNTSRKWLKKTCLDVAFSYLNLTTLLLPTNRAWNTYTNQVNGKKLKEALATGDKDLILFNLLLHHMLPIYRSYQDLTGVSNLTPLPTLLGPVLYSYTKAGGNYVFVNYSNPLLNASVNLPDVLTTGFLSIQGVSSLLIPLEFEALLTPRPGLVPCPTQIPPPPIPPPSPPPPSPPPPPVQVSEYVAIKQALQSFQLNKTEEYLNLTCLDVGLAYTNGTVLLAPDDAAWHNVSKQTRGPELVKLLQGDDADLVIFNLLLYHIMVEYRNYQDFTETTVGTQLQTFLGLPLTFATFTQQNFFYTDYSEKQENATITGVDLLADYVVAIEAIDKVLIPLDMKSLVVPRPGYVPCPAYASFSPPPPPPSPPPPSPPNGTAVARSRSTMEFVQHESAPAIGRLSWNAVIGVGSLAVVAVAVALALMQRQ